MIETDTREPVQLYGGRFDGLVMPLDILPQELKLPGRHQTHVYERYYHIELTDGEEVIVDVHDAADIPYMDIEDIESIYLYWGTEGAE